MRSMPLFGAMLGNQKYTLGKYVETDSNYARDNMKYAHNELSSGDCEVREKTIALRIHHSAGGWFLHPKWDSKRSGKLNSSLSDWSTSYN